MGIENLCTKLGCAANCCGDILMVNATGEDLESFPDAIRIDSLKVSDEAPDEPGVYFACTGTDRYKIGVRGPCPNVADGQCSVYETRPGPCRKLEIGSPECIKSRLRKRQAALA